VARVALLADMHGNAIAFRAALADVRRQEVDQVVSLGDVAQGGPQPAECIDILRDLGCRCVSGNSDEFLLTLDPGDEDLDDAQLERVLAVGRWSQEQLSEQDREFIRGFEPTVELELDGLRFVCCHGSPRSNEQIVLPETPRDEIRELIGSADAVAGGHVHLQWSLRLGGKLWLCAGSVGLVYEHKEPLDEQPFHPIAEYAIVTALDGTIGVELRRIPFDAEKLIAAYRSGDMPAADWYAAQWRLG
jgi:predicted phosphodiesterase